MLRFLKVSGESLTPLYQDGDFVLVAKIPILYNSYHQGDFIAFHHEIYGTMIKQVDDISTDRERLRVTGTHDNSVDSTQFGAIHRNIIIGKVIWHIKRPYANKKRGNGSK